MNTLRALPETLTVAGMPRVTAWRSVFSFRVFLGVLLLAGVFAGVRQSPPDPDTWWHAAVGEQILRQGAWPVADP